MNKYNKTIHIFSGVFRGSRAVMYHIRVNEHSIGEVCEGKLWGLMLKNNRRFKRQIIHKRNIARAHPKNSSIQWK